MGVGVFESRVRRRGLDTVVYRELIRSRRLGSPLGFVVLSRHENQQNGLLAEGRRRRADRLTSEIAAMIRRYDLVVVPPGARESVVVIAPECDAEQVGRLAARLAEVTPLSAGAAAYPSDGHQVVDILSRAWERLGGPLPTRAAASYPESPFEHAGVRLAAESIAAAQL